MKNTISILSIGAPLASRKNPRILFVLLTFILCIHMGYGQNIGINTLSPQEKLHVKGNVKVDSAVILGTTMGNVDGSMRFNPMSQHFEGYNGNAWIPLDFGNADQAWVDSMSYIYRENARVGIGLDMPDSSAVLELASNDKGFLMPRLTSSQRDSIVNPANGLQIFNIDNGCIDTYVDPFWKKQCASNLAIKEEWIQQGNFGGPARFGAVGFSIGGKGYIGLGMTNAGLADDFWEYDPTTDTWTQMANFGGGVRAFTVGFSIGNKGYVGTGSDGGIMNSQKKDFWEFDPGTNTWTQLTDFGGTARSGAAGFGLNGKGYIGTGESSGSLTTDFWEYDPVANTWTSVAAFIGSARKKAVAQSVGGKGYLGLGENSSLNNEVDFYEYDPIANAWTLKSPFIGPANEAYSFNSVGRIYVSINTGVVQLYEYDPVMDTWTQKSDFDGPQRSQYVMFSINDDGYLGTGTGASIYMDDFWKLELEEQLVDWISTNNNLTYSFGNVGIGEDTPTHPLHMGSGARCTEAGVWTNASDRNRKYNIAPIHYGLETVMQLSPKSYRYKVDHSSSLGFIAQEIREVIPEVVNGTEGDLGVAYGEIVAVLVQAIQEQQVLIKDLQRANEKLEISNSMIINRLDQLEGLINEKIVPIKD